MASDPRKYLASVAALGLAIALSGCGRPATPEGAGAGGTPRGPARTLLGWLDGGPDSARIGLVIRGDDLLAYVCSGEEPFNKRNCVWLTGKLSSTGVAELTHPRGLKLSVESSGDRAKGTVTTAEGQPLKFQAAAVSDGGTAGVYRASFPNGNKVGWIVDDSGFVGGTELNAGDGGTLGFWKSEPGVTISAENQRGMLSLSYNSRGFISSKEIERVASPVPYCRTGPFSESQPPQCHRGIGSEEHRAQRRSRG